MCKRRFYRRVAEGISWGINPLVVATLVFVRVVYRAGAADEAAPVLGICLFFAVVLPLAYVGKLFLKGDVEGLFVVERGKRQRPLKLVAGSCWIGGAGLWLLPAPVEVTALMLCYAVQATLMLVLTWRWKVSLHAAGAWCSLTALYFLADPTAPLMIPLALAVSWSRVALGAHTPAQVLGGSGAALVSTWLLFQLFLEPLQAGGGWLWH